MKYLMTLVIALIISAISFAKEISTEIVIEASPDKVWTILTDFENYPNWNPFIILVKGKVIVGSKIMVSIEPADSKVMTFKPKILKFETNKELSWIGHFIFPGLFDGEHKFELIDNENGTTTFRQSEKFRGILVPFYKKKLDYNTKNGFMQMNQKLKEIVEQK